MYVFAITSCFPENQRHVAFFHLVDVEELVVPPQSESIGKARRSTRSKLASYLNGVIVRGFSLFVQYLLFARVLHIGIRISSFNFRLLRIPELVLRRRRYSFGLSCLSCALLS